jgi:hypothetical protein
VTCFSVGGDGGVSVFSPSPFPPPFISFSSLLPFLSPFRPLSLTRSSITLIPFPYFPLIPFPSSFLRLTSPSLPHTVLPAHRSFPFFSDHLSICPLFSSPHPFSPSLLPTHLHPRPFPPFPLSSSLIRPFATWPFPSTSRPCRDDVCASPQFLLASLPSPFTLVTSIRKNLRHVLDRNSNINSSLFHIFLPSSSGFWPF